MTVPQTLPASRDTVENSAAPKASIKPTIASRNRTQTCESPNRGKRDGAEFCGLFCVRSEITGLSLAGRCFCQHMTAERRVEVTEDCDQAEWVYDLLGFRGSNLNVANVPMLPFSSAGCARSVTPVRSSSLFHCCRSDRYDCLRGAYLICDLLVLFCSS